MAEDSSDEWELTIRWINNGFLLDTGYAIVRRDMSVCDNSESVQNALLAMDLLDAVQEYFNLGGSKHDQRRCHTILIPGTKFEFEDDDFDDEEHNWLYHWLTGRKV